MMRWLPPICALLALLARPAAAQEGVVVIGHPGLDKMDPALVQRIFTGRVVEVGGVSLHPINAHPGSGVRARFLRMFLDQDDDKYVAYWTVRRHIGKGVPPRELASAADVIRYVQSTPGAVGYIEETQLVPGLNVVSR